MNFRNKMSNSAKEEMLARQAELRRLQREKDRGNTVGTDSKDPCKKVFSFN